MQVVVVDEIGSPAEAAAVRGIAQRGVAMVGTAHGTDLSSLLANPDLNSLIGGVHQVTLGDAEARSGPAHLHVHACLDRLYQLMSSNPDPRSKMRLIRPTQACLNGLHFGACLCCWFCI